MMTEEMLTCAVKEFALAEGADLVGIAPVARYENAPSKLRPQAHMPEAKAVVVMAVHHVDASVDFGAEPNSNYPAGFQVGMIAKLDTLSLRMAKFLELQGYRAVPYSCTYFWRHRKWHGVEFDHAASFSHMNAFVAAGLGEYGWHGMVMSPKYGPRQRIVSVFTDAPLAGDPLYRGEALCDRCKLCEKACWGENYKPSALLEPATIRFAIEDKEIEYANINRWRCFWGEQCHLDMNCLAERDNLDEQGIYRALDEGVPRSVNGPAGYMCSSFKFCMSKGVRYFDRKKAKNPLRRKCAPSGSSAELQKEIFRLARAGGAERIAIFPSSEFEVLRPEMYEGFRADDFFRQFRYVISICRAFPAYMYSGTALAEKNRNPLGQLTYGRLMIGSVDIARYLDDRGFEAMQDGFIFGISRFAGKLAGWNTDGDNPVFAIQSIFTDAPLEELNRLLDFPPEECDLSAPGKGMLSRIDALGTVELGELPGRLGEKLLPLMPSAKSLIVTAAAMPERVVELAGKQEAECGVSFQFSSYQCLREAFWTAQDIATVLTRQGIPSEACFETDPDAVGRTGYSIGTIPDLRAQAELAAAAGLGFVGRSGFLLSEEFGPRLRFSFVLTEAVLPASRKAAGKCPPGCTLCADACPVKALEIDGGTVFRRNDARCEWARVLGMSAGEGGELNGYRLPDLPVPELLDDEARASARAQKDPIAVRCYENPDNGAVLMERCLQACPYGKKGLTS